MSGDVDSTSDAGVVSGSTVQVLRGGIIESIHRVHAAVVDADGVLRAHSGDASFLTVARSAVKPLQSIPLVEDGGIEAFGFTTAELALMCASHSGEPMHVDAAHAMLAKADATEEMLACGAHEPFHEESAAQLRANGQAPGRIHNNCSGKHAGMLALARLHGWPVEDYHLAAHAVQRRMLKEVSRWSDVAESEIPTAIDGCGVITFALPLRSLARAFARLARQGRESGAAQRVIRAMTEHPEMVGGTGRLCTRVMQLTAGRAVLKVGAEGVYCAALTDGSGSLALKVEDGGTRALYAALVATLRALQWLPAEEADALPEFERAVIRNTRGEDVGVLRAQMELVDG